MLSDHQIALRGSDAKGTGNYPTHYDFMNKRTISSGAFIEGGIAVNGQFALISSAVISGTLAVGSASQETTGGFVAAALPGAVGTASASAFFLAGYDSVGNKCELRQATTNDPITVAGRKVFGLVQADIAAADGTAIGAAGSENVQVAFVVRAADGSLQLVSITDTIEIAFPRLTALRHEPALKVEGSSPEQDVVMSQPRPLSCDYEVTTRYLKNEVISLPTGAGATAGAATPAATGDTISSIGATNGEFMSDHRIVISLNGEELVKNRGVFWDSGSTYHISVPMEVGDVFTVTVPANI
jgi:hypothetical protein